MHGQKLRRITRLRFGLITFQLADKITIQVVIFMISGFPDVSLSPTKRYTSGSLEQFKTIQNEA